MSRKNYCLVTAIIFTVIALLHLARLGFGWTAVLGGWSVPMWLSWPALAISAFLAWTGGRLSRER